VNTPIVPPHATPKPSLLPTFVFFQGTIELAHSDPRLHEATTVSITFRYQKRDERDDIITHHRNLDPVMCPVKAWAHVVRRLLRLFEVVLILKGWTCDSGGLWTVLVLFFKDF